MQQTLVTIGAINYNNAKFVIKALDGIRRQTYANVELIIIDDYSTDNSVELINKWLQSYDRPYRFIAHDSNKGVCATLNNFLRLANGTYIAAIATDDIMLPNRIKLQVEALENTEENICAVFSDMTLIDGEDLVIKDSYFEFIGVNSKSITDIFSRSISKQISFSIDKNIFPAPTMMYKKAAIIKLNGWDENLYFEDWDMHLRLIHAGYKFIWLNDKLVNYRFLPGSLSRKPNPRYWDSYLTLISKYIGLSKEVDKAISDKLPSYAFLIYQLNGENSLYWLKKRFLISKDIRSFGYMALARFGVKYKHILGLKQALGNENK
jgi:glycosyltransferase involved in cell wall biosynthesis